MRYDSGVYEGVSLKISDQERCIGTSGLDARILKRLSTAKYWYLGSERHQTK